MSSFLAIISVISVALFAVQGLNAYKPRTPTEAGIFPHQNPSNEKQLFNIGNGVNSCANLWLNNNEKYFVNHDFSMGTYVRTLYEAQGATSLQAIQLEISASRESSPGDYVLGWTLVKVTEGSPYTTNWQNQLIVDGGPLYSPPADVLWAKSITRVQESNLGNYMASYHSSCDPSIQNIELGAGDRLVLFVGGMPLDQINYPKLFIQGTFNYQYNFP